MTKKCNRCGELKSSDEYYPRNNICKDCKRSYRMNYYRKNKDLEKKKMREYSHLPEIRERNRLNALGNYYRYVNQYRCRSLSWYYVKRGEIERMGCAVCGKSAEMHHPNYKDPKNVVWLCRNHHIEREALCTP
jgi:hypothetical protein